MRATLIPRALAAAAAALTLLLLGQVAAQAAAHQVWTLRTASSARA